MLSLPFYVADLAAFTEKKSLRNLDHVHVAPHLAEATDSYRLVQVIGKPEKESFFASDILLSAPAVITAAKIARAGKKDAIELEDQTSPIPWEKMDFPRTDIVIKENEKIEGHSVILSVQFLLDLLQYAKKHGVLYGGTGIRLTVRGETNPVAFTFPLPDGNRCDALIMPIKE